jgi:3-methyladenine DNA glycosylase Tag
MPVSDDQRLFEKICLEGFQAGLSWLTILNKREAFRQAFAGFDMDAAVCPWAKATRATTATRSGAVKICRAAWRT